jgi:ABC-type transporter Mla MlaB component
VSRTNPSKPDTAASTQVALPSDLVNCDVEALRQTLLSALVHAQPIEVQSAEVARAGTAALQLLLSFAREAERRQVSVRLPDPAPALLDALRCLGLAEQPEIRAWLAA